MTTTQEADRLAEEARVAAMRFGNACEHHGYDTPTALERERQLFTAIDRLRDLSRNPSVEGDAARLDHLQKRGATVEILPGGHGGWFFRIGGLHAAVHANIRMAIDAAMAATPKEPR